jgi:predicted O-methyltransferase YrrM
MAQGKLTSFLKTLLPGYQTLHLEYPVEMKPRYGFGRPPHSLLSAIIGQHRSEYKSWLAKALDYTDHLVRIPVLQASQDPSSPHWQNGFLPGLDITMLYTIVASSAPSTYIEIGSGNSTKVVAKAIKNHNLSTKVVSLDPSPRAEIDELADVIIRQPFENADLGLFSTLKSGDVVFVDNSHRMFPNSDATVFFMEVLPLLPKGVIVHVHDVYLPYDYPQEVCDRYYSEQYALAAFVMANPEKYHTIMPNFYVSEDPELCTILNPLWDHPSMAGVEKHGASYWLEIKR